MRRLQNMGWKCVAVWCAVLCSITGCGDPDLSSDRTYIEQTERPDTVDRSRIVDFTLQANGVDLLGTEPRFARGVDLELAGTIEPNSALQTRGDWYRLIVARRPIVDGEVDWSPVDGFPNPMEWSSGGTQNDEGPRVLTRFNETVRLDADPGDYELRHYLIIRNDLTEEMPSVFLIGTGKFTVLPGA